MPVVATMHHPPRLVMADVRAFLRDYPHKNILLDDVEFEQSDINRAMRQVVSWFNAMTPQTNLDVSCFPHEYVLLIGVASHLMSSESFHQVRNQATYQDGDVAPIGVHDKVAQYQQLGQVLRQQFEELCRGIKTQNNMEAAYSHLGSGYTSVYRTTR
jgi:hypothetical protein